MAPTEACGIVTPDLRVTTLPNVAPNCSSSYAVDEEDLVEAILDFVERTGDDYELLTRAHFIIWHTHPNGQVGPSRGDLEYRLPDFQYLVVTLPGGEGTMF